MLLKDWNCPITHKIEPEIILFRECTSVGGPKCFGGPVGRRSCSVEGGATVLRGRTIV